MQLNITSLSETEAFNYSASQAEMGPDAGRITWKNNVDAAPTLLDSPEKLDAFRDFIADSGGWTREDIAAMPESELNALCHQWIMGDIREAGGDALGGIDWTDYQADCEAGRVSSRLYFDGTEYWFDISR